MENLKQEKNNYYHITRDDMIEIITLEKEGNSFSQIATKVNKAINTIKSNLKSAKTLVKRIWNKTKKDIYPIFKEFYKYSIETWQRKKQINRINRKLKLKTKKDKKYRDFYNFILKNYLKIFIFESTRTKRRIKKSINALINAFKLEFPDKAYLSKSSMYRQIYKFNEFYSVKMTPKLSEGFYKKKKIILKNSLFKHVKALSIDSRPKKNELVKENGNLLIDSIIGKRNDQVAICSTFDLKSGKLALSLYKRDAKTFLLAFENNVKKLNFSIKTITCDNGHENVEIAKKYHNITYATDPYCSWQKGEIENIHKLVRYFIPKGQSLNLVSKNDLEAIENYINQYLGRNKYLDEILRFYL